MTLCLPGLPRELSPNAKLAGQKLQFLVDLIVEFRSLPRREP